MTIEGFWDEVNSRHSLEKYRLNFTDYVHNHFKNHHQFLTVGIDIFQWIFEHSQFVESLTGFPEDNARISIVVSGIASKLRYLISLPLNFVIVFDGKIKMDKQRWKKDSIINNNIKNSHVLFEEKYLKDLELINNNEHIMKGKLIASLTKLLESWNISYIHAPGDAEIELARLNQANVIDAIISNDADAFAYGAKTILRNFSRNLNDKPNTYTKGIKNNKDYFVTPVNNDILNQLNLDTDKIMFIACFQGDDYSNGIKGLGIKKSWALVTNKSSDFDVVQNLKNIYVSDFKDYIKGKMPHPYLERIKLLEEYKIDLKRHITRNGRAYFGRIHSLDVELPNDRIIASHYYPYFAKYLFKFDFYDTNINEVSGMLKNNLNLPNLPQPLSIKSIESENQYIIRRGNDLKNSLGYSTFINQICNDNLIATYDSYHWFTGINYDELLILTKTGKAAKEGYEFLADSLGKCYVWKALVNFNNIDLQCNDIFIKEEKNFPIKSEKIDFEQKMYQVKFKPRQFFKDILSLDDKILDNNLNEIEEKHIHVWMAAYLFELEQNGRKIVSIYNEKIQQKNSVKSTPKRTPKKKRTPTQKTTLDILSNSSKSPIKIIERKNGLLDLKEANVIVANKRSVYDIEDSDITSSPKKKMKPESVDLKDVNSILVEPFEEDIEVSRVLDNSDYIGDSFVETNKIENDNFKASTDTDNNNTRDISDDFFDAKESLSQFMLNSRQSDNEIEQTDVKQINEIDERKICDIKHDITDKQLLAENDDGKVVDISDLSELSTLSNQHEMSFLFPVRKEFKKSKLAISRGISLLDQMTRLPEVPQGPENELDTPLTIKNSNQNELYELNDTFSSTDSMEKLFANEKNKQYGLNESNGDVDKLTESNKKPESVSFYDDSFSSTNSMEKIFGMEFHKDGNANPEININSAKLTESKITREVINITDDNSGSDVHSDFGTLKDFELTPMRTEEQRNNRLLSQSKELGEEKTIKFDANMIIQNDETYSLPSDFEGSEILLAESTDDDVLFVMPKSDSDSNNNI